MITFLKTLFNSSIAFLSSPVKRWLLCIAIIAIIALVDFFALGIARRTFVFYNIDSGEIVVENRMLRHARTPTGNRSKEEDIIIYTEGALLGPVSKNLLPLFSSDTRLRTLLLRDRVVYADLSQSAALPPLEGGNVMDNFQTLHDGILRNFPYVKGVRFFIEGNRVFLGTLNNEGFSYID